MMGLLALALWLEPLPLCKAFPTNILGEDKPVFDAWDCHNPKQIQVLEIPEQCTNHQVKHDNMETEEKVTIYQRSKKTFLATRCRAFKSKINIFCGMFSHEEIVRPMEIKRPMELSIEECEQMHSSGVWTSSNNRNHPIKVPGVTYLNYIEAGRMVYHHHQVSCEGADVVIDGKIYEGIVTLVDVEIEVKDVAARKTSKGFEVKENDVIIGESSREGKVTQAKGTFLWKGWWKRVQRCPLVKMTNMKVKLMTAENNQTIIFNEKHKIYIILTNQVLANDKCERGAYFETNLDNILVKRKIGDEKEKVTRADLSPEVDVNIGNLVNEINDYAVGVLRAEIQASEERSGCKRMLQQVQSGNVEKLPSVEGELTMVRGELAIQVKCQPVKVVHRLQPSNLCFELLPVQHQHNLDGGRLFLEPISRVLKKDSAEVPCPAANHGFQASDGRFYRASPQLVPIEKPTKSIFDSKMKMDTSSGKGIYSKQQLQRLDMMLGWSNLKRERQDSAHPFVMDQPIWSPDDGEENVDVQKKENWWSLNHVFSLVSKWKYGLVAVALPSALGLLAWCARIAGLASGCSTDARMGGVGILNTVLSLFCHSYLQGRKQAQERRQAIPEVNLKMNFLQQVDHDVQEMKRSNIKECKKEVEEAEENEPEKPNSEKEEDDEVEAKPNKLF